MTLETVLDFTNFCRDHFLFPYQHLAIKKMMQVIHQSLKFAFQNFQEFCLIWAESLLDIQVAMHWNSLQSPIYVIISFDNTNYPVILSHQCSTTSDPPISQICLSKYSGILSDLSWITSWHPGSHALKLLTVAMFKW